MPGETTRVMNAATSGGVRTAAVNGIALAYREQGEGEAVVLVHGSASDLRSWEQQLPAIGTRYRAIAYSRRYARPNEDIEPGADDQMLPHVDDLAALLRVTGAAPAHLVGHSWGRSSACSRRFGIPRWFAVSCSSSLRWCRSSSAPRQHPARSSPCSPGARGPRWRSSDSGPGRSHPRNGPSGEAMTIRRSRRSLTVCSAKVIRATARGTQAAGAREPGSTARAAPRRRLPATGRGRRAGYRCPDLADDRTAEPCLPAPADRAPAAAAASRRAGRHRGRLARDAGGEPGRRQRGDPRLPRSRVCGAVAQRLAVGSPARLRPPQ